MRLPDINARANGNVPGFKAQTDEFDAFKWQKIVTQNIRILQKKVNDSAPHRVISKELDDLVSIVSNSFEQIS
jgi:hypothetical protein